MENYKRSGENRTCVSCGAVFHAPYKEINRGKGKCCSLRCAAKLASANRDQSGPNNNNWKGGIADNTGRKKRYRAKNPEKHAAHLMMRNAIRSGKLIPESCKMCGCQKVEGHHTDYSKPLSVVWLCKEHHLEAHGGRFAYAQPVSIPAPGLNNDLPPSNRMPADGGSNQSVQRTGGGTGCQSRLEK